MDSSRKARLTEEITAEAARFPVTKIVRRRWRNARRRLANKPLTGVFFWVPVPKGKNVQWELMEFYDKDHGGHPGDAEYANIWPDVVHFLAFKWHKPEAELLGQLADGFCGLPRGRVILMADGKYSVRHGNDVPLPGWENAVRRAFCLKDVPVTFVENHHENMFPGHSKNVQNALGINNGNPGAV